MAVSAPGDMPDPSQVDPGMWARLMNYINPIQPAQAADSVSQGPNPLANPSPVDSRLAGGGPPVPPGLMSGGQPPAPMPPGAPTPPVPASAAMVAGGGSGGGGASNGPVGPSILPQARGAMPVMGPPQSATPWFTGGNTPYAPNPAVGAPMPVPRPANPAVARGNNRTSTARIPPTATALAGGSPFTQLNYRPNADAAGGALSRGGPPQMTALDLSRLFGRS